MIMALREGYRREDGRSSTRSPVIPAERVFPQLN